MKKELDAEATFLKDFKPDSGTGSAHLAAEQAKALAAEADEDEDEDEEGVITIDHTNVPVGRGAGSYHGGPHRRLEGPISFPTSRPQEALWQAQAFCQASAPEHATQDRREALRQPLRHPLYQECSKEILPFEKHSCLNCGLPGHRVKDCKQPDKPQAQTVK